MDILCYYQPISESSFLKDYQTLITGILAIGIAFYGYIRQGTLNRNAISETARLNRIQTVENTIIKQLEFHYEVLDEIEAYSEEEETLLTGKRAFGTLYKNLELLYVNKQGDYPDTLVGQNQKIQDTFTDFYQEYGSILGSYYKNLYLIIDYIDDIIKVEKLQGFKHEFYIDLVKAQLSKYEILLLAYDCVWMQADKPPGKNFIEFARDYHLLTALEAEELIRRSRNDESHRTLFRERFRIIFQ
jgi:hypothetical protein